MTATTGQATPPVVVEAQSGDNAEQTAVVTIDGTPPDVLSVPALPLLRKPAFPGILTPPTFSCPDTIKAILKIKAAGQPYVGLFLRRPGEADSSSEVVDDVDTDIYDIGALASIQNIAPAGPMGEGGAGGAGGEMDGTGEQDDAAASFGTAGLHVYFMAHRRIKITDVLEVRMCCNMWKKCVCVFAYKSNITILLLLLTRR